MSRPARLLSVLFVLILIAVGVRFYHVDDTMAPRQAGADTPDPAQVHVLAEPLERALQAYNAVDLPKLRAEFSAKSPGLTDNATFQRLFFGYYMPEFGRIRGTRLSARECSFDPDRGMLVFDAAFDKHPKVKLSANFLRESGVVKLVQMRFEKVE